MIDLSCDESAHMHYWHDTAFNQDFLIPETFIQRVTTDLVMPLNQAQDAISRALDILGDTHPVSDILRSVLPVEEPDDV